jgi:hypothetical protein
MRFKVAMLFVILIALTGVAYAETSGSPLVRFVKKHTHSHDGVMWLNHLDFQSGNPDVTTAFNLPGSPVGLSGLEIRSTSMGDTFPSGGNKTVQMGIPTIPGTLVTGARVCYEVDNGNDGSTSFITQIRLAQLQDPPSSALVRMDDATDHVNPGPICVDSQEVEIDPADGALRASLRLDFDDTSDVIVIQGYGVYLETVPLRGGAN